jgi:hypothetical protein
MQEDTIYWSRTRGELFTVTTLLLICLIAMRLCFPINVYPFLIMDRGILELKSGTNRIWLKTIRILQYSGYVLGIQRTRTRRAGISHIKY